MDNDSLLSKIAFIASIAIDLVSLTAFFVFRTFNETPYGTILSESFVKSVKSRYIFQGMVFGSLMLFFISLVATVIMVFLAILASSCQQFGGKTAGRNFPPKHIIRGFSVLRNHFFLLRLNRRCMYSRPLAPLPSGKP